MDKLKTYTISAKVTVISDVDIKAECLEDTLEQSKNIGWHNVAQSDTVIDPRDFEIIGVYDNNSW